MADLAKQLRIDAQAYRESIAAPTSYDLFSLAYQWQDGAGYFELVVRDRPDDEPLDAPAFLTEGRP